MPPRLPTAESFDGRFNFCRLQYEQVRWEEGGQGWWTDYPDADINFSIRLSELTKTRISRQEGGAPNHLVVSATDDALFQCPFIEIEDAGTASFSDQEVTRLRRVPVEGWVPVVGRLLGACRAQLVRVGAGADPSAERVPGQGHYPAHAVFRTMFPLQAIPQIPSIQHWRRSGGQTSERGSESAHVDFRGIEDRHGRLMVLMTHNTDISDAWEREGEDPRFFYQFSPEGYAVGINIVLYPMTH